MFMGLRCFSTPCIVALRSRPVASGLALLLVGSLFLPWMGTVAANVTARTPNMPSSSEALTPPNPYQFSPVKGPLSSPFGKRTDPITGSERFHAGLDFSSPEGTPIYAPQPGVVVFSGWKDGYGNVVVVQHHPNFHTVYAHASARLVGVGDRIVAGQPLALVGSTGRSTGPHLHFETIVNQQYQDPNEYLAYLNVHPAVAPAQYWATIARMPLTPSPGVTNATILASNTKTLPQPTVPSSGTKAANTNVAKTVKSPTQSSPSTVGKLARSVTGWIPLPRALRPFRPIIQATVQTASSSPKAPTPKALPIAPTPMREPEVDGVPLPLVAPLSAPITNHGKPPVGGSGSLTLMMGTEQKTLRF
ncbi:MAG: peptidoglycan DD-metalloendopeptidase family protein [Vampirovibrionales bacterium]|nr:peptidoglycan DD-metalloendopeptidase family protein [Vampirovibrionales bacterium]